MRMSCGWAFGVAVGMLACAGCTLEVGEGAAPEERVGEAELALLVENGLQMNGTQINGMHLNGMHLNGMHLNGMHLNGMHLNGTALVGTVESSGETVEGAELVGTNIEGVLADSSTTTLSVESVSTGDIPGIYTYVVKSNGASICGDDAQGRPIKAIALEGTWNYATGAFVPSTDQFTMACRGAAIAKCVEWGYPRWSGWSETKNGSTQTVPLRYFHEACVRTVRADYCGNGVAHTVDGTIIDVWDTAGIQVQTLGSGLLPEAEWSASGATCIKRPRYDVLGGASVQQYIQTNCPSRWAASSSACMGDPAYGSQFFTQNGFGAAFATRPLLRNASGASE